MNSRLILASAVLALLASTARAAEPAQTVDALHAALLDNMKHAAERSCSARAERLRPIVDQTFDFPALARHILRKQWPELDETRRGKFVAILREQAALTYGERFAGWNGESFVVTGEDGSGDNGRVVRVQLTRKDAPAVRLDYALHKGEDGWRVVNVIAEGVSDLALRAAQYQQLIRDRGLDGLLAALDQQLAAQKAGCS